MTAWIGLTGGIGSGKSQVAADFSVLGVPVIDADAIAHRLTETPCSYALQQIAHYFGDNAITASGSLNRAFVRERVFNDARAKQQLEAILHPMILSQIMQQQTQFHTVYGIVEIPTLIENPLFQQCVTRILLVVCCETIRVQRVMARSQLSASMVQRIIATQASDAQRCAVADDIIYNEGGLNILQQAVLRQHQIYQKLFQAA